MSIESLGGYRIVRKLGEGPRAEVFLGFPEREGSTAAPAAIKVYRSGVARESIITEAEAHARAWGDHAVELLDLATAPDGAPALLLGRLSGHSLARLVADRHGLRAGEAITILAPLAMTVARLHQSGVTHGAVRAEAVLFDAAGAPVLACLGRAALMPTAQPPAALLANPGVIADLEAMAGLTATVLDRVHDDGAVRLRAWVSNAVVRDDGWLNALVARLFELGEPEPIAMAMPAAFANSESLLVPARTSTADPVAETPTRAALALPDWVQRYVPSGDWVALVRGFLASVRPRLWIVSGGVGVALVAAVLLVPAGQSDATPQPSASATADNADPVDPAADTAVTGDDPAVALVALLRTREQCIRDVSVLCLDAVAQVGSAALSDDQQLVRDLQAGAEIPASWMITDASTDLSVDERMGGSAIVTVIDPADSEPASFLLVKGEAGWRIRDYLWQ